MADINTLRMLEELRVRVDRLEGANYSPPLRSVLAAGYPNIEIDDPSHYARINGAGSAGKYPHIEVVPDLSTPGAWVNLAAGRSGTLLDSPAWETNRSTSVPVDGSFIAWIRPHPDGDGWIFDASAATSAIPGWYALINGGTGPYSWAESEVDGTLIGGGRTGTNNAYEQISGLTGIPNGGTVVVWMTTGSGGQPYHFNARMFSIVTAWGFSGSGAECEIVPTTIRTIVISGPNLCGSLS